MVCILLWNCKAKKTDPKSSITSKVVWIKQVARIQQLKLPVHFENIPAWIFIPLQQQPIHTTDVTIRASTQMMTSRAIKIPRQLRWFGLAETSWKKEEEKKKEKLKTVKNLGWKIARRTPPPCGKLCWQRNENVCSLLGCLCLTAVVVLLWAYKCVCDLCCGRLLKYLFGLSGWAFDEI